MFFKLRLSLLFVALFACNSLLALEWQNGFYTDDSGYYLKLHSAGFVQRFRLDQQYCNIQTDIKIVFKSGEAATVTKKSTDDSWPKLFGVNESDFCWFEVNVSPIDLNAPQDNFYVVKIVREEKIFYLQGYSDSLLIKKRIVEDLENVKSWINLGQIGSTPVAGGGVFYKIWEPIADRVDLFIEGQKDPIVMAPSVSKTNENNRVHVAYQRSSKVGDQYYFKFFKNGKYEELPLGKSDGRLSSIKIDPMASEIVYDSRGAKSNSYVRPRAVVVERPQKYRWRHDKEIKSLTDSEWNNWIIYELWPLTFNPPASNNINPSKMLSNISEKINYLNDLGINSVELMPVGLTRFGVSWGYAPDSILAFENNLGKSDDLKRLVDDFHANKIKVLLDVVVNHINNNLIRDPLSPQVSRTKYFGGATEWGDKPDYSNIYVRRWIADSLLSLMRDFHLDGFRFDFTKHVHAYNKDGFTLLQELNYLIKQNSSRFYSSAEELEDNVWITKEICEGGAGFDSQWNDKFKNFFEKQLKNYRQDRQWVDLNNLQRSMLGYSNHVAYGNEMNFGSPQKTVNYLGSHDFVGNEDPILRIVSAFKGYPEFEDSREYVPRVRPLEETVDTQNKFKMIHNDFTHAVGRLTYGIMFTKPGAVLFYQGEELAQDINIQNEWSYTSPVVLYDSNGRNIGAIPTMDVDVNRFIKSHRMPWEYHNPQSDGILGFLSEHERGLFSGYYKFFQDMIKFRKMYPGINNQNAFNVKVDNESSIITYQIQDEENEFFIVANFGHEDVRYWMNFPQGTDGNWWTEIINSSAEEYGGRTDRFQNIVSNLGGRRNLIRLDQNSMMVFKAENIPIISKRLFLVGDFNTWAGSPQDSLVYKGNGFFKVTVKVDFDGIHRFKLATSDWSIEMGNGGNGYLTYLPDAPNLEIYLKAGSYDFEFDAVSYKYQLVSLIK